jgi:hypothetical protein
VVQKKLIIVTNTVEDGDFALNANNPIEAADGFCPNGYTALISDGQNRVATQGPNLGNGQVDWPIASWTEYVNANDETVWATTELTLLGVSDDHVWQGLEHPIGSGAACHTGLMADFTTAPINCLGWTVNTGQSGENRVARGLSDATDTTAIGPMGDNGAACWAMLAFYCVEQ